MREATRGLTLRQIIEHMLDASGLVDFYKTDKEGKERLENLEELINAAEGFVTQEGFGKDAVALPIDEVADRSAGRAEFNTPGAETVEDGSVISSSRSAVRSGQQGNLLAPAEAAATIVTPAAPITPDAETGEIMSPLGAFLTHASLEAGDNQAQSGQDAIQLMTVHSAKGLEFDCVFIAGLEEGLFPHENSASDADGLEEERRLMYVAITRARKRLYLSFSQTRMLHGQTRYHIKSRFFDELPEAALKWITPRNQGFGSGFARDYQSAWSRGSGLGSIVGAGRVESRQAAYATARAEGAFAWAAVRPGRVPQQVRRRRHRHPRGRRRGCSGPGQLRPPRHEVAGALGGKADPGRLSDGAAGVREVLATAAP
jgi:DNA helicase-2/ATP-dependent DNA helicase PcrA